MTDDQIKYMTERFLAWRLPANFSPDDGISFKAAFNENTPHPMRHEPSGTNLFDYTQAEAMIRHMVDGMPAMLAARPAAPVEDLVGTLFDAISHGDETHRAWLKQAIDDHFAERPVNRPAAPVEERNEIGWLIEERDNLHRWYAGVQGWTSDPDVAVRFCREADAARTNAGLKFSHTAITQHVWLGERRIDLATITAERAAPVPAEGSEDYYPSHEALSDIVHLLAEECALNGGGPGWEGRWKKAIRTAGEIFEP